MQHNADLKKPIHYAPVIPSALPENGYFVRGSIFRESGKHTLMKMIIFMGVM
jgi:hypothetical protein